MMKSHNQIEKMLAEELLNCLSEPIQIIRKNGYYNESLGDTSFLLSGLLGCLLEQYPEWEKEKWLDDSLITNIKSEDQNIILNGVIIWGRDNTTEEWTDPFCFSGDLDKTTQTFRRYTFLFGDLGKDEISYSEYKHNRDYWNGKEYNWRYIINHSE